MVEYAYSDKVPPPDQLCMGGRMIQRDDDDFWRNPCFLPATDLFVMHDDDPAVDREYDIWMCRAHILALDYIFETGEPDAGQ